ncbi:MAG: hypothetical protein JNK27_08455 [Chitinophagaceae bacterium]|nr:hypothetical protein [Chitinophagaceae bacterium]
MRNCRFINISFTFILLALTACKQNIKNVTDSKKLELSAFPGGIKYLDTTQTIHIGTTLFNPTDDTLSFVTMTCSYEDLFLTDTSIFKIQSRYDCFSNSPTVTSIPPKGKLDQFIMVKPINKDIKIGDQKLKIGMYLLTPKIEDGFQGIVRQYEQRQSAKIIWSNELDMKRLYRNIYK